MRIRSAFFSCLLSLFASQRLPAGPWTGSGPQFKTIKAVAVSPQHSNVVYAGAFGWGVFKSTDAGASWINARTGMVNTYVRSLLVLSDSLVYAGTNDGIARTTDGGISWTVILTTPFSVRSIARDPSTGSLYGATYGSGLYKSTNAGTTWSQITVNDPNTLQTVTHLWSVAVFGHDSLYVGGSILDIPTGQGGSLFRSVNGGTSWFQMQFPTAIRSSIKAIAISPLNAPTRFIMGTAAKGVYLSTNGGSTFTNIDGTGTTAHPNPDPLINTVVFTPTTYYAGGDSLGGAYLRAISDVSNGWTAGTGLPGRPAQINSICIDPGNASILYLGTDGQGVFKSTNGGTSWFASASGMMGTSALAFTFNGAGKLFLGTDDGDGMWTSADSGKTWGHVDSLSTVDGVTSIVRTANNLVLYCGTLGAGVHKTTDGGVIWRITDTTVINHFVRSLLVDPTNSNILYAGTSRGVFKSTNAGTTWSSASSGIPATALVRALDIDASNPSILLAGTDSSYIFRSTNGGSTWTNSTNANGFLTQDIHIRSIRIDQTAPSTVYAGVDSGRVYKSADGGQNWTLLATLPAINSVRSILIHPSSPSTLFAATFGQGIFVSTDAGAHWATDNAGLTDSTDQVIETDRATPPGLLAGSRNSGVFRSTYAVVDQPPVLAPVGNKSTFPNTLLTFNVSATDPDATIPALGASPLPAGATFVDHADGQGTFSWTPGQADIGPHGVVFRASDGTLTDSEAITITVLDTSSVAVSVQESPGWNMVSVPVAAADGRKTALFPSASSSAFLYAGTYHVADTLHPGDGYWLKFPAPVTEDFGGGRIPAETLAVVAGWNMIGTPSGPVVPSDVTPLPPVTLQSRMFGYAGGYAVADTLRPGRGYWVRSSQPGQIVLVASAGPGIAPRQGPLPGGTSAAPAVTACPDTIRFTDAEGRSAALLLGTRGELPDPSLFDLPPAPPPGAFDVRFSTGRSAASSDVSGIVGRISIEASSGPLRVRWSVSSGSFDLSEGRTGRMPGDLLLEGKGEGVMASPADGTMFLRIAAPGAAGIPARARLIGSYPNPFNPLTNVAYELPRRERVSLKVYDLLGREVAVLADGVEDAGTHSAVWNAAAAASGVYISRLVVAAEGETFTATERLVLIK